MIYNIVILKERENDTMLNLSYKDNFDTTVNIQELVCVHNVVLNLISSLFRSKPDLSVLSLNANGKISMFQTYAGTMIFLIPSLIYFEEVDLG